MITNLKIATSAQHPSEESVPHRGRRCEFVTLTPAACALA